MYYNDGARQVKLHPWKKEVHVLHMKQINLMKDFMYLKDFYKKKKWPGLVGSLKCKHYILLNACSRREAKALSCMKKEA